MATRSNIYVENDEGYIGVYSHYDGYPEHMVEQLQSLSHKETLEHILVGGAKGGFRLFSPVTGQTEYLNEASEYIYDPGEEYGSPDYIYIKRRDGSIRWRMCDIRTEGWKIG
jgi:hypothetical protein